MHNFGQFMKRDAARNLVSRKTNCSVILIRACSLRLACPRVSTPVKTGDKQLNLNSLLEFTIVACSIPKSGAAS